MEKIGNPIVMIGNVRDLNAAAFKAAVREFSERLHKDSDE